MISDGLINHRFLIIVTYKLTEMHIMQVYHNNFPFFYRQYKFTILRVSGFFSKIGEEKETEI